MLAIRGLVLLALAVIALAGDPGSAFAQTKRGTASSAAAASAGGTIQEIRIEGAQRVDPQTILSYMTVAPGDRFDQQKLDASLKAIFDTGLFADVTLRREGDVLTVVVSENPIINRLAFEGNRRISDEDLQKEVQLRPRVVFTQTRVQQDVQRILALYRRQGRFAATVEPQLIFLDQNRVDLVFEINEGEITGVDAINFVGNSAFSGGTLRSEIATKETAWYRFLSNADTYDPDRLAFDSELLRRFYLTEGYADFRVLSTTAELNPDRSGFVITFTIEEGERYKFGNIDITSTLRGLDPETLKPELEMSEGDWYNAQLIDDTVQAITDAVFAQGYAFVEVRPRPTRDREARTIGVTFEVSEGPRLYVNRIEIEGNLRTLDKVIRREMRLVEGDPFNAEKLRRSRKRIEDLSFFRTVDVTNQPAGQPDRTDIIVKVEEQSTGEISFGAGVSSSVGLIGNVQLRERNLLGTGNELRASFQLSGRSSEATLSYTDSYFLDRNLSAGVDLFRTTFDQEESSFNEERIGGGVRFGYQLSEYTRQILSYTLEQRNITNVDDDAPLDAQLEEGKAIRSSVGQRLIWDRRNRNFNPSEGFILELYNQLAGLGGDVRFLKNTLSGTYFFPVGRDMVLSTGGDVGYMIGLGQNTRISDRFFLGGDNFRGFSYAGIGPRETDDNDALGGTQYARGRVELSFPLGLPDELQVRGKIFTDFGSLWDSDSRSNDVEGDTPSLRMSAGPGLLWNSPFGPVSINVGYPFLRESYDKTEYFNFSFGTTF